MKAAPALERAFGAAVIGRARPHPHAEELPLVAPDSIDGLAEAVRFAARERLALVPCGAGTKLGWTRPPARADFVLSTRNLRGIVAHVPDDGTLSARAGTSLAELRARAREHGHWLVPDAPGQARATLGGVLASGHSGPDRTRFGPVRNHVLGMRVLLADGSVAVSGGQLVKNVTGYDLHRLYTGSHGTLCVILEAALRLFPFPEQELWFEIDARDAREALTLARAAGALPLRFLSLSALRMSGAWKVAAHLGGTSASVAWERGELARAWPGASALEGERAARRASEAREARPGLEAAHLHLGCRPSRLDAVLGLAGAALGRALEAPHIAIEPRVAEIDVEVEPEHASDLARRLRAELSPFGATCALRNAPAPAPGSSDGTLDAFGDDAPGFALMRRLKRALDPQGVFAPGRFLGGL